MGDAPILEARDLHRDFTFSASTGWRAIASRRLRAVRGADVFLQRNEALAVVGESGCGKSTLARMLLGLLPPSSGAVFLEGADIASLSRRDIARRVQPVFQDPFVSLNPKKTAGQIVGLPLVAAGGAERRRADEAARRMLDIVGLSEAFAQRFPWQMSGGERQRVSIARALIAEPRALICDEPTSALDVSVQAQILNLLQDLRDKLGLSYLVITHNLAVVDHLCERMIVMYFGRVVEEGPTRDVLDHPLHPYTSMLRNAVLEPGSGRRLPEDSDVGGVPDPLNPPAGCAFRSRCSRASEICAVVEPSLVANAARKVACHHPLPSAASRTQSRYIREGSLS